MLYIINLMHCSKLGRVWFHVLIDLAQNDSYCYSERANFKLRVDGHRHVHIVPLKLITFLGLYQEMQLQKNL